jgi:hypothetical protein
VCLSCLTNLKFELYNFNIEIYFLFTFFIYLFINGDTHTNRVRNKKLESYFCVLGYIFNEGYLGYFKLVSIMAYVGNIGVSLSDYSKLFFNY